MFMMSSVLISTQCSHSARLEKLHETVINNVHMKKMDKQHKFHCSWCTFTQHSPTGCVKKAY